MVGENQVVVDAKNLKVNFYIQFHALANISSVSKTQFVLNYIAFKSKYVSTYHTLPGPSIIVIGESGKVV